jgi:hypothetical protein
LDIKRIVDRGENHPDEYSITEALNKAKKHSLPCPSKAGQELQPWLMQASIGDDHGQRKAASICDDEKRGDTQPQPDGAQWIRPLIHELLLIVTMKTIADHES